MNVIESRRPNYDEDSKNFRLLSDSYKGGFTYINDNNLQRFYNESDTQYNRRLEGSTPVSYVDPLISETINTIFSKNIVRPTTEKVNSVDKPLVEAFIKDVGEEKTLEEFMRELGALGSLATIGVLVDNPTLEEKKTYTVDEIINEKIYPNATLFTPEKILNYKYSNKLEWVMLDCSYTDIQKDVPGTVQKIVIYDTVGWKSYIRNIDGSQSVEEGEHNLGYVPFKFCTIKDIDGDKISHSILENIAINQKKIYNYLSLIDQAYYQAIFTYVLIEDGELYHDYKESNENTEKERVPFEFNQNCLIYAEGTKTPTTLKSDFSDTDKIHATIDMLQKMIYRQVSKFLDENSMYAQSGSAKEIDLMNQNNNISVFSQQLEEAENWILKTFCDYMDIVFTEDMKSVYPNSFDVKLLKDKIDESIGMMGLFADSKEAQKIIKKDLFYTQYENVITDEQKEIIEQQLNNELVVDEESSQ